MRFRQSASQHRVGLLHARPATKDFAFLRPSCSTTYAACITWARFFRAADGVGLQKLCLAGITAHPPKKAISKTALGAEMTVAWEHDWDAVHMAERLRRSGFEIAAIEISLHAVDLFEWQPRFPVCVVFGNEVEGLRPELLEIADAHVRIPMLGQKESLNVATAGGIVLYELLRKYKVSKFQGF